ncbi:hypothetical protein [Microbacterium sp. A93]|uniref:hypothetical protein n=1 Tax=Microbacterium sp. A93 TaxID=3450716 RepID=UPI003F44293A
MAYPPHAPQPEDQRPSWYTPAPEPTGPPQPPAPAPEPGHARRPGDPYAGSFEGYAPAPAAAPASEPKPFSPAMATVGWVLTVLFGLLFILFFFAGVDAFNSNVTEGENAYNVGVFLGFFLILLIPAVPILLGIRLIRQPRRQRRIR